MDYKLWLQVVKRQPFERIVLERSVFIDRYVSGEETELKGLN
jgi:hypothetical protein